MQKTPWESVFGVFVPPGAKERIACYLDEPLISTDNRGILNLQNETDFFDVELGLPPTPTTGRTPFTKGSTKAWSTVISNSVFHTASTPLALMQLKVVQDLSLSVSELLLLASWGTAAGLNSWANYYKYIERSTPEFGLEYVTDFNFIPEPGRLYFHNVTDGTGEGNNNGLHYLIHVEKNGVLRYDVKCVEHLYDDNLKVKIKNRQWEKLTKLDSEKIKSNVESNHIAQPMADADFIPGTRQDNWFILLCCISLLPALSSGSILGYTSTAGQTESNRVAAAATYALFNYIRNLLCDMPIIANAYGKNEVLGNMGPIALQLGAWLIINAPILLLLRNIAPAFLALTTWAGLTNDSVIPSPFGFIGGLVLFPYITSSFLLFIMLALLKLNLQQGLKDSPDDSCWQKLFFNKTAITSSLGLEHSLANWKNPIAQFFGEILGGRFITVNGPLKAGLSPQANASLITSMKAIGDFALIFGPTFDVVASFFTFINSTNNASKLPLTYFLLGLGAIAAFLSAITQWPNFVECCERRQKELNIPKHRNSIANSHEGDSQSDNNDDESRKVEIYLASKDPKYALMQEGDKFRNVTLKDLQTSLLTHSVLYGRPPRTDSDSHITYLQPYPSNTNA